MGYGYPAAIGAKVANPNKLVVCIDGDGSFQMTMSEMATAAIQGIKVVVIVINNYYLGMVRQWQELFYKERYSSSFLAQKTGEDKPGLMPNGKTPNYIPDFVKFAGAYGVKAKRIFKNEDVQAALKEAIESNESYLIEAMISPNEKVFPMVPAGAGLDDIIVDMA